MAKIFISYRRQDSRPFTERIDDHLRNKYGEDQVFKDVDDIPSGADFRQVLQSEIQLCDVVLVIIGQQWISIEYENGQRRLDDPNDFVRIEVEAGLRQGKLVIPVLVDNASFPNVVDLPYPLQDLAYRNAIVVRYNPDFKRDIKKLIRDIDKGTSSQSHIPQEISEILPSPFDWCYIPEIQLDTGKQISPFFVAKYPITNPQYQTFLDAEDGFKELRWWNYSDLAHDWRIKNKPLESGFRGNSRPQTRITWFDAKAFCNWLTYKTGDLITLPTEKQRKLVVQGEEYRIYPWGNEFNNKVCNTREFWFKATTDVDKYPEGVSQQEVFDLAGNTWEWGTLLDNKSDLRPMFGGGYQSRRKHTTASHFRLEKPSYYSSDVGFRIYKIIRENML